ncbi:zinc ribbon domain-containing protein [Breoghania sp.]|uniref:zinc ribbon domain-containing protein n=1 Tax=Breoghania sp. TaxID=2065378 RepID=UPI002AA6EEEC|nr:zinc ribbon domain-containing protein [Breoghania sp.]
MELNHKFCMYCGATLNSGDKFCGNCGRKIAGDEPQENDTHLPNEELPSPEYARERPKTGGSVSRQNRVTSILISAGLWCAGWFFGSLAGALIFTEVLYPHAIIIGTPIAGIATTGTFGGAERAMITGVDFGGIMFWGICGLIAGAIAAAGSVYLGRNRPGDTLQGAIAVILAWCVAVAVAFNVKLPLLVVFAPLIGWFSTSRPEGEQAGGGPGFRVWAALSAGAGAAVALGILWLSAHF